MANSTLNKIKQQVLNANQSLPTSGLVKLTWGNVSGAFREEDLMVIKPSGVDYQELTIETLVTVCISTGEKVEGDLKPSSDTETHLEIYRAFKNVGGITHTHSRYATIFSQAGLSIPCFGTSHADHFNGTIPVARALTEQEVDEGYEHNTGKTIVETFNDINPDQMPAVLLKHHGPFTWGHDALASLNNSIALEEVAFMAHQNLLLQNNLKAIPAHILNKHNERKHGPNAYYGQ